MYFWLFIVASDSFSFIRSFFMMLLCWSCCLLSFSPSSRSSFIISSFSAFMLDISCDDRREAASSFSWSRFFLSWSRSLIACWNFLSNADKRCVYSSVIWFIFWFCSACFSKFSSCLWKKECFYHIVWGEIDARSSLTSLNSYFARATPCLFCSRRSV